MGFRGLTVSWRELPHAQVASIIVGISVVGISVDSAGYADLAAGNIALAQQQGATGAGMVVRGDATAYRYSEVGRDRHNLAHAGWHGLVEGMTSIFAGCRLLLRPGGILAVTARPVRRHGTLVDLPTAVVTAGIAAGLTPVERCVALLAAWRDGRLVARPSFFQLQQIRNARRSGVPLHLIAHEDAPALGRTGAYRTGTWLGYTGSSLRL